MSLVNNGIAMCVEVVWEQMVAELTARDLLLRLALGARSRVGPDPQKR